MKNRGDFKMTVDLLIARRKTRRHPAMSDDIKHILSTVCSTEYLKQYRQALRTRSVIR